MGAAFRLPAVASDADALRGLGAGARRRALGRGRRRRAARAAAAAGRAAAARARARQRGRRRGRRARARRRAAGSRSRWRPGSSRSTWRSRPASFCTRSRVTPDLPNAGNDPILIAYAGLLGAVIGSFLNVCILRWGAEPKQSVVRPPSRCPKCGAGLRWYDNVPIVSWLAAAGPLPRVPASRSRRSIRSSSSPRRSIWAFMAWRHGFGLEALRGAVFGTLLLGIAMTDARAYIIPDEFSIGGLALGVLFALWPRAPAARHRAAGRGGGVRPALAGRGGRRVDVQAGGDGRRRHQDDGDGRRVPRLAGDAAHDVPRRADRQPHLRAAQRSPGTRSWCRSGSSSPSARRPPYLVGPAILAWYSGYLGRG